MYAFAKRTEKPVSEILSPDINLHERMKRQERQLAQIMQVSDAHKSVLSRIARIWGIQPWWLKGIELLIISAPTIAIAIITQTWILFAATAAIGILFIGVSLLLDNHYTSEKSARKSVSTIIDSMVSAWNSITSRLFTSATVLQENIVRMDGELERMEEGVDKLHDINGMIDAENFATTVGEIDKNACELAQTAEKLTALQEIHEKFIEESNQKMASIQHAFAANNARMTVHTKELELVIEAQKIQAQQADAVNATLKETLRKLVDINNSSREQGAEFHASMHQVLQNAEARFDALFESLNQTGARYSREVERMAENNLSVAESMVRDMILTEKLADCVQARKEAPFVKLPQNPIASCRISAGMFQPEQSFNPSRDTGFIPEMVY